MTIDEMAAVLEAAKDRKQIQYRCFGTSEWVDTVEPVWNFADYEYRAKPEPVGRREWWLHLYKDGRIKVFDPTESGHASGEILIGECVKVREV
jgi:hypothetical protein